MKASELMASAPAAAEPVLVYTGPTRTGTALIAAVAADADQQATPKPRGKKSRVAKKPDAADKPADKPKDAKTAAAKPDAKPPTAKSRRRQVRAKPAGTKHAAAKPDAANRRKPAASGDRRPSPPSPRRATKPAAKPANNS